MSSTLLSHKGCGGSVVLDASKLYHLIAPSFGISTTGINHIIVDVLNKPGSHTPEFLCYKCYKEFSGENLKTLVVARCTICGNMEEVGSGFMHNLISCICSKCTKLMKDHFTDPDDTPEIIRKYIDAFGLTKPIKVYSLYKILSYPLELYRRSMSKLETNKLAFGADPEFFASCYGADNQLAVVPPVVFRTDYGYEATIEPGDREGKHPVFKYYGDTKVHEDGAAFEMSTPPSNNWREVWDTIHDVKDRFGRDFLEKYSVCNPVLSSLPTMNWQVERWMNRGKDFRLATRFGCDPDMDAVDSEYICNDIDASSHTERYAGGHIHISGIPELVEKPLLAIRSLMMTAGLAAVAYSDVPDLERRRTFLYGRPSKFRPQKYPDGTVGVEYRTPSTRWTGNFELAEQIFTWATIGIKVLLQKNLIASLEKFLIPDVCKAIVEVDQNRAKDILKFIESKV